MTIDRFKTVAKGLTAPAASAFAVNPSNSQNPTETTRAIYIGGAGALALATKEETTVPFAGLAAGTLLPVSAVRVLLTGTTATNVVGFL